MFELLGAPTHRAQLAHSREPVWIKCDKKPFRAAVAIAMSSARELIVKENAQWCAKHDDLPERSKTRIP
ncbi:hypothetical protein IVB14_21560 [Bradyrhizobium sp. 180]|uniref:hypothetical protein n=1 Tax=unclassified Bradyrhizobium TaxID=2631580 RepID=UPI001FF7D958|nr:MULTISPECIES: hypothetical protein [unclassified Bradyrhizobium]MCK1423123.1 hypothetical protein [Bradyrhizobium sp. CW12]MCK1492943.1 hypothetical protein [Bradyrhizobium sp. 180]MCK1531246.1 hypothetical protein [Bradyrhizobium sp. 182]MCK1599109.1 hypothetical protein [Bradyrhizobium sp. 164]MCK1645057.1 hypothetical protein [Bradyrhizobium sp. 154]